MAVRILAQARRARLHHAAAGVTDVLERRGVERVGHGQLQGAAVAARVELHRHGEVRGGEVVRQLAQRLLVERLPKRDARDAGATRQRVGQLVLVERVLVDQHLDEVRVAAERDAARGAERGVVDEVILDEHGLEGGQVRAHGLGAWEM